jgi:superfamily II DNA or RNA helicase
MTYEDFLQRKTQVGCEHGFEPVWMPDKLFPFQVALTEWAIRKGRAAIFADCGLGKTFMQLTWAENVARKTGGRVLILTPLAVAFQTVKEGEKIGVEVVHRRDGIKAGDRIVVTNYERLHHFDANDFTGVVLDESSILKAYTGKTKQEILQAFDGTKYKLACTATPAPNDYMELGNHSEFLGVMRSSEMLAAFFINDPGSVGHYRIKGHADAPFWKWMASWSSMIRKPSDAGFDDAGFDLPPLRLHDVCLDANIAADGMLFPVEAYTMSERRAARKATIDARVQAVIDIANQTDGQWLVWCDLNDESAKLTRGINGAAEVKGADSEESKERAFSEFKSGIARVLVSKPSIAGWGMNFQNCAQMAFTGMSDSYEQYYQAVRRCWRFGQRKPVDCYIVTDRTEGQVVANVRRKAKDADDMAESMRMHMKEITQAKIGKLDGFKQQYKAERDLEIPAWLKGGK